MKYSFIFGTTAIQFGELAIKDAIYLYEIYKDGECISTRDFAWCRIFGDVDEGKMKISLCESMNVCLTNCIFEKYIPSNVIFNKCKIIDNDTELWYDCEVITPKEKDKELLKREPWLKDILFPESKCYPIKSILFKKNEINIEYLNPSIKLIAKGFTCKILGQRRSSFDIMLDYVRQNNTKSDSSYNDGLDIDQQSQAYWEEQGLF